MTHERAPLVVDAVIPARDVADTLGAVVAGLPARRLRSIIVVDNGSHDATSQVARDAGAVVLREPDGGHGAACQAALAHLSRLPQPPDAVVFLSGDASSDPGAVTTLLEPFATGSAELVIGVRGHPRHPPIGDRVAIRLIKAVYRHRFHDPDSPMRAIRFPALVALGMSDRGSGWHVEMQVRALKLGLRIAEVAVGGEHVHRGKLGPRVVARSAEAQGRSIFHILRHATVR